MTEMQTRPIQAGPAGRGKKKRILTGDRPTGKLHLGHYVGSIQNRVKLQSDYECFFIVADYHVLTTAAERSPEIGGHIRELLLDYLSVGTRCRRGTVVSIEKMRCSTATSGTSDCT